MQNWAAQARLTPPKFTGQVNLVSQPWGGRRKARTEAVEPPGRAPSHPVLQPPTPSGGLAASHPGFHCAEEHSWMTSLCKVYEEMTDELTEETDERLREQLMVGWGRARDRESGMDTLLYSKWITNKV